MTKIVIIGSCRFGPYEITAPNARTIYDERQLKAHTLLGIDQEASYREAAKVFYADIDACDEVWLYAPDGIGKHTQMDLDYAKSKGKLIRIVANDSTQTKSQLQPKGSNLSH